MKISAENWNKYKMRGLNSATERQTNTRKSLGNLLLFFCFIMFYSFLSAQEKGDVKTNGLKFSGSLNINTNGISPVPAFSLGKPAIIGLFSLKRKRLSFDPEIAFSLEGKPWFINPSLSYKIIDRTKFNFSARSIYSLSHSYPEILQNGIIKSTTKVEPYVLLQLTANYLISEKTSIGFLTFQGHGFQEESIQWGKFFILSASFVQLNLGQKMYYSVFPQLLYVNLDNTTDGFFAAAVLGIGHKKLPFFLSTQLTQALSTNISPNPGFKWNVGLTYNF